MPDDARNLPAETEVNLPALAPATTLVLAGMPIGLQIFFEPTLNAYCKDAARYMSSAKGFVPPHLLGKVQSCFAVVSRSLTWRLDPFAVAQATYETPEGKVGYMGSLCQAILVQSGHLIGGVKFKHEGDWARLRGKFKLVPNQAGKGYHPVPAWEQHSAIEDGLAVVVSARLKDEDEPREMPFYLSQAYPRFSTLWATDPMTQIQYTAVRRFGTSVVPELYMGVPFDRGEAEDWAATLKDVTPARPELADYTEPKRPARSRPRAAEPVETPTSGSEPANEAAKSDTPDAPAKDGYFGKIEEFFEDLKPAGEQPSKPYHFGDQYGEVHEFGDYDEAVAVYAEQLEAAKGDESALVAVWDNGAQLLSTLREQQHHQAADALNSEYGRLIDEVRAAAADQPAVPPPLGRSDTPPAMPGEPAGEHDPLSTPDYNVVVACPEGMSANEWFKAARAKLTEMTGARRPPGDFARFPEANKGALERLKKEMPAWRTLLAREIDRGAQL
jgi:hypothetical protein